MSQSPNDPPNFVPGRPRVPCPRKGCKNFAGIPSGLCATHRPVVKDLRSTHKVVLRQVDVRQADVRTTVVLRIVQGAAPYARPVVFSTADLQRLVVAWERDGLIDLANELRERLRNGRRIMTLAENLLGEHPDTLSEASRRGHERRAVR